MTPAFDSLTTAFAELLVTTARRRRQRLRDATQARRLTMTIDLADYVHFDDLPPRQQSACRRWWRAQPPSAAEVRERALEAAACGWPDQAG